MKASFLDINHLNDQMHEMTYIWQSQAPVSFNMSLTIKCLLKECKAEELPYSLFFSNGYRKQRKFMRIEAEKKNILVLHQWADLYQFSKVF